MGSEKLEQFKLDLETQRAIIREKRALGGRESVADSLRNKIAYFRYFGELTKQQTGEPWKPDGVKDVGLHIAELEIDLTTHEALGGQTNG